MVRDNKGFLNKTHPNKDQEQGQNELSSEGQILTCIRLIYYSKGCRDNDEYIRQESDVGREGETGKGEKESIGPPLMLVRV